MGWDGMGQRYELREGCFYFILFYMKYAKQNGSHYLDIQQTFLSTLGEWTGECRKIYESFQCRMK